MRPDYFDKERRSFLQSLEGGRFRDAWGYWDRTLELSPAEIAVNDALSIIERGLQPVETQEIAHRMIILARLYELAGNSLYASRFASEYLETAKLAGIDDRSGKLILGRCAVAGRQWDRALGFIDEDFFRLGFSRRVEGAFWRAVAALESGNYDLAFRTIDAGSAIAKAENDQIWIYQLLEVGVRAAVASGNQPESLRRCSELEIEGITHRPDLLADALILSACVNGIFLRWREAVSKAEQVVSGNAGSIGPDDEWILWAIQEASRGFIRVPFRKVRDINDLLVDTRLSWKRGFAFSILAGGKFVRVLSGKDKPEMERFREFYNQSSAGPGTIPPHTRGLLNIDGPTNHLGELANRLWAGYDQEKKGPGAFMGAVLNYKKVIKDSEDQPLFTWLGNVRFLELCRRQGNEEGVTETLERIGRIEKRIGLEWTEEETATSTDIVFSIPDLTSLFAEYEDPEKFAKEFLFLCRSQNWFGLVYRNKVNGRDVFGSAGDETIFNRFIEEALEGKIPFGFFQFEIEAQSEGWVFLGTGGSALALKTVEIERERRAFSARVKQLEPFSKTSEFYFDQKIGFENGIVGNSRGLQPILEIVARLKENGSEKPVLITGETGTGKEVMARAVHQVSPRSDRVFTALNCGAISRELIQSELFGHRKGAFTGANENRLGAIRASDGGTLFLDEIGELPIDLQANLLRFLQEGVVKAVGGETEDKVDVRVIAATNRNLEEEISRGSFRSDLYQRLKVVTIEIPPLRERREDIPLLVNHFLAKENSELQISQAALEYLSNQQWKGNIRELENQIGSVTALLGTEEKVIQPYHFQGKISAASSPSRATQETPEQNHFLDLREFEGVSLREAERLFILRLLTYEFEICGSWKDVIQLHPGLIERSMFRKLGKVPDRIRSKRGKKPSAK